MSKKIILILSGVFFFSWCYSASALLVINEVMYDLSGADSTLGKSREWIEIYNSGASDISVDATKWRIYDGGANRTINGEVNFSISAGAYIIFAGDKDTFLADHAGFVGTVYDTGIASLNNTGATLKILDSDGAPVDTLTYTSTEGAAGDGSSLQKVSGAWVGAVSTPGAANEAAAPPPSESGSGNGASSASAGTEIKTNAEMRKIKAEIRTDRAGFAGIPISFEGLAFGYRGEELHYGKYFWNFGDGDSRETNAGYTPEKFTRAYFYPGEYDVSLEYYTNNYSAIPDAEAKITVKVVGADILISSVGNEKDFFVELANNTNYEADISGWALNSGAKSFTFPKNTVLGPKKKIIIPPYISRFNPSDKSALKLMTPAGELVHEYTALPKAAKRNISTGSNQPIQAAINIPDDSLSVPPALAASPILSGAGEEESQFSYLPAIIFAVFLSVASGGLYFIRKMKSPHVPGDDFELLDE